MVVLALLTVASLAVREAMGVRPFRISGEMMEPTLLAGDRVLARRSVDYDYGDVVVAKAFPGATGGQIGRIVAKAGDSVRAENGALHRSDKLVQEPYTKGVIAYSVAPFTVKPGEVLLLPDNRGALPQQAWTSGMPVGQIMGKVVFIYAPGDRRGSFTVSHAAVPNDAPDSPPAQGGSFSAPGHSSLFVDGVCGRGVGHEHPGHCRTASHGGIS